MQLRLRGYSAPVFVAAVILIGGCSDNGREAPLSGVDPIEIPVADVDNQQNTNISNPTLTIPTTYSVAPGDTLTMVWSDEFDGPALDPETWFFATGDGSEVGLPGGWGNNELQYYLPDNAMIVNGVLEITARRETAGGLDYTSARINTEDRFAFQYGRIEASIKLPSGQGLWPAFWMLSQDSDYLCDGEPCVWAAIGEIDVVEAVNLDGTGGNEIFGTIHYGGEFPQNTSSETRYTPSVDVTEDFHTYAIEWDADEIRWYIDDTLYAMQNSWFSSADNGGPGAPFDQPFHVLLNVAVGGNFPGSPNGTTPFPATMQVDWVRVYSGEEPPVDPAGPGVTPDDVISARDGSTPDLTPTFETFGSGATFVGDFGGDNSYSNVVSVTVGAGYGGGALAQLGLTGLAPGFAAGYDEFVFKVKGLTADNTILAKLEEPFPGTSVPVQIDLTAPPANVAVTDLGDGWSQVVIQMAAYGDVSTFSQIVFQTLDGAYAVDDTFYLADIGFNNAGGGGGSGNFVNGDFETGGLAGWTLTQVPDGVGSITADASMQGGRAGTVARLVAAGSAVQANDVLISQEGLAAGTVAPGDLIDVSFDLYGSLAGAGGVVFVEVIFLNGAGQDEGGRNFVGPAAPYTPTGTWTTHSGTVTAGTGSVPNPLGGPWDVSGGVVLSLKVACGPVDGCGVDASFDNVTFTITNLN
ncbi:MAG: glycoside hydrolase family 16 protein [Woeseiaceae bacterium]